MLGYAITRYSLLVCIWVGRVVVHLLLWPRKRLFIFSFFLLLRTRDYLFSSWPTLLGLALQRSYLETPIFHHYMVLENLGPLSFLILKIFYHGCNGELKVIKWRFERQYMGIKISRAFILNLHFYAPLICLWCCFCIFMILFLASWAKKPLSFSRFSFFIFFFAFLLYIFLSCLNNFVLPSFFFSQASYHSSIASFIFIFEFPLFSKNFRSAVWSSDTGSLKKEES